MPNSIQSFIKGMNTDTDVSSLPQGSYRRAENYTFTTIEGGTSGALENVRGNTNLTEMNIFGPFDHEIVGYINIVKDIVFFTYKSDGVGESSIWLYDGTLNTTSLFYSDKCTVDDSKLNFNTLPERRVVGIGRYENEKIRKIYWTDGEEEVRYANLEKVYLEDPEANPDCSTNKYLPVNIFSMLPNVSLGHVEVTKDSVINGGNLKSGTVQYAYKLFNKYGAETVFSTATRIIRLSKYFPNGKTPFYGSDLDEGTNKSVKIFFKDIDISFDYIKVFSIFYKSYYDLPTISLIHEGELIEKDFYILDTGNNILEIPFEEYSSMGGRAFTAQTLASKNNLLFAANINEEYFDADIDCRAYSFNKDNSPVSTIYSEDATKKITISPNGDWSANFTPEGSPTYTDWDIPEDFDSVNFQTDIYSTIYDSFFPLYYLYDINGTIGGTGKYVNYEIRKIPGPTLAMDNSPVFNESVLIDSTFKTNEVYRFGVVFLDKKGRKSFVKWIADILIPQQEYEFIFSTYKSYFISYIEGGSNVTTTASTPTYIHFEIDTSNFLPEDKEEIAGAQIVYVERTKSDMTVLTQGFANDFEMYGTDEASLGPDVYPKMKPLAFDVYHNFYFNMIYSPDITMGGLESIPEKAHWETVVTTAWGENIIATNHTRNNTIYSTNITSTTTQVECNNEVVTTYKVYKEECPSAGTPFKTKYEYSNTGNVFTADLILSNTPRIDSYVADYQSQYGPTSMLTITEFYVSRDQITDQKLPIRIIDFINDSFRSRYGGLKFSNRVNNIYIPASTFIKFEYSGSPEVLASYGDTFISMYEQMVSLHNPNTDYVDNAPCGADNGTNYARQYLWMAPLESQINYNFANNKPSYYMTTDNYGPPDSSIFEVQAEGIAQYPDKYPDALGDLYSYNNAYSVPAFGLYPKYTPKPLLFEADQTNHVMVIASEKKTNGEYVDNWTKFLYANLIEVDTEYGGIKELKSLDNKLFFWQEKGFGTLAVNDRSLLTDQAGSQLALGSGGVLERYDYFSNNVGVIEKYNVTNSENALFWVYTPLERIYTFDNQIKELSTTGSINSYLHEAAKVNTFETPICMVDHISHETLFKINDEVLVYSWLSNSFTGVYTFKPYWFIKRYDGNYASVPDGNRYQVWQHNSVETILGNPIDRANFYDITYDSYIKFIINENYINTKVFDNISWFSTSLDLDGTNIYDDTFNKIRFTTDYQNTDWVDLYMEDNIPLNIVKNITRRERSFFMQIPRDKVITPQGDNLNIFEASNLEDSNNPIKFKRRMRDKFINVELQYDNTSGNKFFFPYVNVNYRQSVR